MPDRVKLFFDGGCRGVPPTMAAAVVVAGRATIVPDLGPGTSGEAEWLAAIHAATIAGTLGLTDVVLLGDSADVVAKANGAVACRGVDADRLARFRAAAAAIPHLRIRRIGRSQNLAGIALAARAAR